MAKKAWDKIRDLTNAPIGPGDWKTNSENGRFGVATITVRDFGLTSVRLETNQTFEAAGLRELAEFCFELSDQLERGRGK